MNRLVRLVRLAPLLALVAACSNDSARSLLPIDINAAAELTGISAVDVTVSLGVDPVVTKHLAWDAPAGQPLKVGLYLPHSVDGTVNVQALAVDAGGATIGASDAVTAVIHPGKTADLVTLQLTPRVGTNPDGGALDGGGDDGAPGVDLGPEPDGGIDLAAPEMDVAPGIDTAPAMDMARDGGAPDRTPDGPTGPAFGTPENLEPNDVNQSYAPQVAVDGKGNTAVCWEEDTEVKCRRWDAATKMWSDTKVVESKGGIESITLKMAPNGHGTLMWRQQINDDTDPINGVWAAQTKDGGLTWTMPPKQVHSGGAYGSIELAVSHEGHARAAWAESVSSMHTLWSARYDDTTSAWLDVAAVKPGTDSEDRNPRLAMDASGAGLLVWRQYDDQMNQSTWATSFAANGPLKMPQLLDTLTNYSTWDPVVAVTPDGTKGLVVWLQSASVGYDVYFSEWTTAGFGAPMKGIVNSYYGWPSLVMDSAANATLVYYKSLNGGGANVVSSRKAWGQPFGPVTPIETTNQASLTIDESPTPEVAIDGAGNVHVAWNRKVKATDAYTFSIVTRRWSASAGAWQPEQTVFMKMSIHANDPSIAVGENGQAAIAFNYWDPSNTGDPNTFSAFAALFLP